jgi:putative transposase
MPTSLSERYPVLQTIGGIPSELISDNGSNWVAAGLEDALHDVGTSLRLAAVRTPTHKAMLERFFRTLDTMLAQKLPGYTYDPKVMGELDYDPTEHAFLTRWELEELISEAIAVYHITDHSSLGMPPARAWKFRWVAISLTFCATLMFWTICWARPNGFA